MPAWWIIRIHLTVSTDNLEASCNSHLCGEEHVSVSSEDIKGKIKSDIILSSSSSGMLLELMN